MEQNFKQALAFVLKSEGGNDDDPADHGGRTSRGITQKEYDAWCREAGQPLDDVWKAPQAQIEEIYHGEYWLPVCPLLAAGIDYLYFDMAVNAGPHQAAVLLQRTLGVTTDGRIGPVTRQAIRNSSAEGLIERYTIVKANWYKSLHQPKFIKGWLNRTAAVRVNALSMLKPKI